MTEQKESLLLPPEYGGIEVEWPFTEFGKKADEAIRAQGYDLNHRVFNSFNVEMDYRDSIQLERTYKSKGGGLEFLMCRNISLPQVFLDKDKHSDIEPGVDCYDFNPEDFVVYDGVPLIAPSVLMEKFRSDRCGGEDLFINGGEVLEMNIHYSKGCRGKGEPYGTRIISRTSLAICKYLTNMIKKRQEGLHEFKRSEEEKGHCLNFNCDSKRVIEIMSDLVRLL
jgi:hypothetical protein